MGATVLRCADASGCNIKDQRWGETMNNCGMSHRIHEIRRRGVQGLMMRHPLLVASLLTHAERHHGDQKIVSPRVEGLT
jgi:hypothetical protein